VNSSLQNASLVLHAGSSRSEASILAPIHQTTTFVQSALDGAASHTYSRASNPTVAALEDRLAALEDSATPVFASAYTNGMAAISALVMSRLRSGDEVLCSRVVYGGTRRLLEEILAPFGVKARFADLRDPGRFAELLRPETALVIVETPANPTLELVDVAALAKVCRRAGISLALDNTFLGPFHQRGFTLGADFIIYSTTKYIDGHNAALGGALLVRDADEDARLRRVRKSLGLTQKPFEAWLTLQGLKTLPLRFDRQTRTAGSLAAWLEEQPGVDRVLYPFLDSHPQRELARRQQISGGALISIELRGGRAAAEAFVARTRLFALAENLGSLESLVTHPASMTHGDTPPEARRRLGISDGLLRLSIGTEDEDDLRRDLEGALVPQKEVLKR
jgi:cystathionine beta-lyase/cystathionine gamma-synthase